MPVLALSDLDARVLDRLDANSTLYTQAERFGELNDSIRALNLFTGLIQIAVPVPGFSVVNQYLYSTPAGILIPLRVDFEGRQLQPYSLRAISLRYRTWLSDKTNQGKPVANWVPLGLSRFAIHPADSRGGGEILVTGIAEPVALTGATGEVITVSDEDAEAVVELAAHVLQIKEGGAVFAQASVLYQKFLALMKRETIYERMKMPRFFVKTKTAKVEEEVSA